MRLSTKGQYAVRAMVDLAYYSKDRPVTLQDIANREDISINYLEQLFAKLRRNGIVNSVRGPGGGYVLARGAEQIRIGEIIEAVEESLVPVACVEGEGGCTRIDKCVTFKLWKGLGDRIKEFLNSITVGDLCEDAGRLFSGLQPAVSEQG
jgi:Rrf2 family iron-sulfur cluster assembly transcriptional regulator